MNTLTHPDRIEVDFDLLHRLRRAANRAFPIVVAVLVFAVIFAASVALRLATMAGTSPGIAATLHRVAQALGLAS
jgi:hypothetical protein